MKKKLFSLAIVLIIAGIGSAHAQSTGTMDLLWGTGTGTVNGGQTTAVPTELNNLNILYFKASDFEDLPGDMFALTGNVKFSDGNTYLNVKAIDVTDEGSPKPLLYLEDLFDTKNTEEFCKNEYKELVDFSAQKCDEATEDINTFCSNFKDQYYCNADGSVNFSQLEEKAKSKSVPAKKAYLYWCKESPYKGSQGFSCIFSSAVNSGLSLDSKIKLQFYANTTLLAETSSFVLKNAQDGNVAIPSALAAIMSYLITGEAVTTPLDKQDTDKDGTVDIKDKFPSIENKDTKNPITITASEDIVEDDNTGSDGGGDCSLNPNASVNGLSWLIDLFVLGLPLGLMGIRRKK